MLATFTADQALDEAQAAVDLLEAAGGRFKIRIEGIEFDDLLSILEAAQGSGATIVVEEA
jgi:hypothetical protein